MHIALALSNLSSEMRAASTGLPEGEHLPVTQMHHLGATKMLKRPPMLLLLLVTGVGAAAISFCDATLAPFLETAAGFGPAKIGLAFTVLAASFSLSSWPAG